MGEPAAEVEIDQTLVAALLREQHPDLAGLKLQPVGSGWDNAIFRLGPDLAVRLPRRSLSVPLVLHEQHWLPLLAPLLPLPIPVPVRFGVAGCGYPWPWTITPWFSGSSAETASPAELRVIARQLGEFVKSLHRPAPADAPTNPYRGVPLAERDQRMRSGLGSIAVDADAVLGLWAELVETTAWAGKPVWLHGDLHPLNLIMAQGRLQAVIDWGDICAGDPATDLAVAWMLFPSARRESFKKMVRVDADTWQRARAWALALGVAWANGDDRLAPLGRSLIASALASS